MFPLCSPRVSLRRNISLSLAKAKFTMACLQMSVHFAIYARIPWRILGFFADFLMEINLTSKCGNEQATA